MDSLELRPIEQAKIFFAKKLFDEISTTDVKYHNDDSYQSRMTVMEMLKQNLISTTRGAICSTRQSKSRIAITSRAVR